VNGFGFQQVNDFARATPWLHGLISGYANYGVVLFAALLLVGWWITRRSGQVKSTAAVACAVSATLLAVAINQPIVNAVHEARPYTAHHSILVLAQRSADFSFPSDHAVMAGAVAAGLWFVSRRLGIAATIAAVLMAFARVYIGAHYPQDVLAGLALGCAVAVLTCLTTRRIVARAFGATARTRLRPLMIAASATPRNATSAQNGEESRPLHSAEGGNNGRRFTTAHADDARLSPSPPR
jgi:Membrane-associated phospholipid phosphatase